MLTWKWLRTFLSAIGIACGVASLVAITSVNEGAKQKALKQVISLGIDTIRIENRVDFSSEGGADNRSLPLSGSDIQYIQSALPSEGLLISGYNIENNIETISNGITRTIDVITTNNSWFQIEGLSIASGRSLKDVDSLRRLQVCVAGYQVAQDLRLNLGAEAHINDEPCLIVGVLDKKGRLLNEGTQLSSIDFDNSIIVPSQLMLRDNTANTYDGITIKIKDINTENLQLISNKIQNILNHKRTVDSDYYLLLPVNLLKQLEETQLLFNTIMLSIVGISLIVGGIGIMNIMLAHVSEQSREIGLRISVGATKQRIIRLYLLYSAWLSVLGSVLGLLVGPLFVVFIQQFIAWPVAVDVKGMVIGPIFALITSILFGIYPSLQASKLKPAMTLREV